MHMKSYAVLLALAMPLAARAAEPAVVTQHGNAWTLQNAALQTSVSFAAGKLFLTSLSNREAKVDYLKDRQAAPLFSLAIDGHTVTANDGGWTLAQAAVSDIEVYGTQWGKRLELTLTRPQPLAIAVRQVIEIYGGRAGLRVLSFLKNGTDRQVTVRASDVLSLNLPDQPHTMYSIEGVLNWQATAGGLTNGGRNAIVRYAAGDGWYLVPENNWATCLEPGAGKAHSRDKMLGMFAWNGETAVRVATNPKAVQLVLFPREEVEYFAVNLGVFKGDVVDGRMAAAEHLRQRYKFHNPSRVLSTNDWQWGGQGGRRSDTNYRNIVIPQAKAAGFDRIHIDDFWYEPEDGTDPKGKWTDMPALCDLITAAGMKPGHWFSLQGKICVHGWGDGRDCADPANVDFKLLQLRETLIGKYHSAWDQVDAGLLWKTDTVTAYSHPSDSVYRKILGMRRYMNTIAHQYPDFIMQTTCEVDNPAGPGSGDSHGNQNVGLLHLADNGVAGMFRRTEYGDDVRDLFAAIGMFPLEGMLSTWGEDGNAAAAWRDSPLWYYQFLLARHTSIYSWPGDWSKESVAHLRVFNDWRKNPRIQAVLNAPLRPVYNGADWLKNDGPWCWMFTNEGKTQALVVAINHLNLNPGNAFQARLGGLDATKSYLVENITQTTDGKFAYAYCGEFTGARLVQDGLPIDLDAGEERCAVFWIQEKSGDAPQVLYADAAVTRYVATGGAASSALVVQLEGAPNAMAQMIVCKPALQGVECRTLTFDGAGRATASFDAATITQGVAATTAATITSNRGTRDAATAGAWHGKYGTTAAWLAGRKIEPVKRFTLSTSAPVYVWPTHDGTPRVLAAPAGQTQARVPACWTTAEKFSLRVDAPVGTAYRLTVYAMDYDNGKRGMEITVKSHDGKVHDRQAATVAETDKGLYLSWRVTGPATIKASKTAGVNAAVSAVFID